MGMGQGFCLLRHSPEVFRVGWVDGGLAVVVVRQHAVVIWLGFIRPTFDRHALEERHQLIRQRCLRAVEAVRQRLRFNGEAIHVQRLTSGQLVRRFWPSRSYALTLVLVDDA